MNRLHGLISPVRVRGVYAADLFAVVLLNQDGKPSKDDLVIRLPGVTAKTIERPIDPPELTGSVVELVDELGPDPDGRSAAQKLIGRRATSIYVPFSGSGWLESLDVGATVPGELFVHIDGKHRSIRELLMYSGHLVSTAK